MAKPKDPAVRFFYEHAGYASSPGETKHTAKLRNAKALADAEEYAQEHDWTYEWEEDRFGADTLGEGDDPEEIEVLTVVLKDEHGDVLASLGGVQFLKRGGHASRDYGRVVEAELALEGMVHYEKERGSSGREP